MRAIFRRPTLCAVAFVFLATSCTAAQGLGVDRVQNPDVSVLPGGTGQPHPLTGIATDGEQPWQNRPILALKVGNSSPERPQAGLDRADVLYEEPAEGGVSRFVALFSTNQADRVGPVRSARMADPLIVAPLEGLLGYSGGVPPVIQAIRGTDGVRDVGFDSLTRAYTRQNGRRAPYNLYARTSELWSGQSGGPSGPLFDFLRSSETAASGGSDPAGEIRFRWPAGDQVRYEFVSANGSYVRHTNGGPHLVEDGDEAHLSFRNLVFQMVELSPGEVFDTAGVRTMDPVVVGSGQAVVFRGGVAVRGTWERSSVSERTRFLDSSGEPLRLAPGKTIVHLLPVGTDLFVS